MSKFISALLYLFVFILPFQTRWIYAPAFLNGSYFEYGTFSLYATEILLGIIVILSIAFLMIKPKQPVNQLTSKPVNRILKLFFLFLIILLNCLLAFNKDLAFFKLTWLVLAAALFCIILIIKPDFKKLSWMLIFSGLIQSAFAIQQFIEQKVFASKWLGMASQDPQILGTPVVENGARWLRTFGTLPHPNMLAGFLLVTLFLIINLFLTSENKKTKIALMFIFGINFFAILTALSRAAILVFIIVMIMLFLYNIKNKIQLKAVALFGLIALAIFILFLIPFHGLIATRALGDSRVENISNSTRIEQYQEFWQIYKNNWIIGVGIGNYPLALTKLNPALPAYAYQPIHNTYLLIIVELGLMGILMIGLFIFSFIILLKSNLKNKSFTFLTFPTLLTCLTLLALFDHFLWSFYFGIILLSVVASLTLLQLRD